MNQLTSVFFTLTFTCCSWWDRDFSALLALDLLIRFIPNKASFQLSGTQQANCSWFFRWTQEQHQAIRKVKDEDDDNNNQALPLVILEELLMMLSAKLYPVEPGEILIWKRNERWRRKRKRGELEGLVDKGEKTMRVWPSVGIKKWKALTSLGHEEKNFPLGIN